MHLGHQHYLQIQNVNRASAITAMPQKYLKLKLYVSFLCIIKKDFGKTLDRLQIFVQDISIFLFKTYFIYTMLC